MLNGSTGFEAAHTCADGLFIGGPRDGSHIVSVSTKSCKSMWNRAEGLGQEETLLLMSNKFVKIASAAVLEPGLEFSPKCDSMAPRENPASTPEKKVIEKWIQVNPSESKLLQSKNCRKCKGDYDGLWVYDHWSSRNTAPHPTGPQALHLPVLLASNLWSKTQRMKFDAAYHHMAILAIICWHEFRACNKFAPSMMNVLQSGIASGQLRCY